MKYRASIYLDIEAENETTAQQAADEIALHLSSPNICTLPESYFNPFVGGVALMIDGDLVGNMKRCEKI